MDSTAKYLIHADVTADGVVERSDVVGAIFGQTEGLLGDELDIRGLQQSSRLGRIDVDVRSENGRSFGHVTISSNLDRVETAILAAALETIDRVGPCSARFHVTDIEDARAAKRREVVERAKELLATAFDGDLSSDRFVDEVRESVTAAEIVDYEGLPAGPSVEDGDAIIVVEGRADVLRLLDCGVKNAVAVEGTDVPDAVAALSRDCTTTAFLDGDRGGALILRELSQVGDVDYVARAPDGQSVEDLSREETLTALREKTPLTAALADADDVDAGDGVGVATDGSTHAEPPEAPVPASDADADTDPSSDSEADATAGSPTLADHVDDVVGTGSHTARLLDAEMATVEEVDAPDVVEAVDAAETPIHVTVVDAEVDQRLLDVAAQRGVARVVGTGTGSITKQPASVRVHTPDDVAASTGE